MNQSKTSAVTAVPLLGLKAVIKRHLHTINVAVSWSNSILAAAGSLLVLPATLNALGEHNYGTWLFVLSFVSQLRILDLGMSAGCMKFSAGSLACSDRQALIRTFNTSAAVFAAAGTLSMLGTGMLVFILPVLYPNTLTGMQSIIGVLGLSMSIDFFFKPYAASLRARSLFFVYDLVEIVTYSIFKLALVLYLARVGLSLQTLALLIITETLIRDGLIFTLALRYCSWTSLPNFRAVDPVLLRKLFNFSTACFVISVAEIFRVQLQNGVIDRFIAEPQKSMAIYNVGLRLVWLASMSIGVVWAVMIPRFSGLIEQGEKAQTLKLLRRSSLITGLLTGFALVSIGVFGHTFLKLWIGKPWIDQSYHITLIALPAYFVTMCQGPANGLLTGAGKMKGQMVLSLCETILNLLLTLALAGPLGITGVCIGMVGPSLLSRSLGLAWILRRDLGIPMLQTLRLHTTTLLVTGVYLLAILGFAFVEIASFAHFLAACLAATAIFGAIVLVVVPEARVRASSLWRRA